MTAEPLIEVKDVTKVYHVRGSAVRSLKALDAVNLTIARGAILGCVGESGCGKSTLAKIMVRLELPTEGHVFVQGADIASLSRQEEKAFPRKVQLVFQDPYGALAPRMSIGDAIEEPLRIHKVGDSTSRKERVGELLDLVGLGSAMKDRYPHQLSGGQRQRVNIARALALEPDLLILDEPVSSLDVSIQAQVLNLLRSLQQRLGLTYLFISHDLRVVKYLCETVAVMYLGSVVEVGPSSEVFTEPAHPYTLALLHAIPDHEMQSLAERPVILRGEVPSPIDRPSGCPFHTRCPMAREICLVDRPALRAVGPGRLAACHFSEEVPSLESSVRVPSSGSIPA
jgi:oligopeptide/dipeptide ABC transporter ATP-binding protein